MKEKKNITERVWDFFTSIKLAIVLFSLIALTSIVGTVIEQRAEPERNIELLSRLFNPDIAPALYEILDFLQFTDMYHSWWFITLLMLFSANLIICSLDRLPKVWKMVKEEIKPIPDEIFNNLPARKEKVVKRPLKEVKVVTEKVLKKHGYNFSESQSEGSNIQLFSSKGSYSRLGVYITHLSILIILLGAIIGIFFGFKGFLNLREGMASTVAFRSGISLTRSDEFMIERLIEALNHSGGDVRKASEELKISEKDLHEMLKRYGIKPLGFTIVCDNFDVEFYGASDTPKEFKSHLRVLKDNIVVQEKTIEVNLPLKYEGFTFYQSSYGIWPGAEGIFKLRYLSKDFKEKIINARFNEEFMLSDKLKGKIIDFSPAIAVDESGRPFTYSENMNNPAILVEYNKKSKWILKRYPETWTFEDGSTLEFIDYWGVQYTGLQVRNDPGVWIVYLGCIIMAVGLYITFFITHRKIWVKLIPEKNMTRIIMGGTVNRNRDAFERHIQKMIEEV